jgi:acyl-CoA thioesterase
VSIVEGEPTVDDIAGTGDVVGDSQLVADPDRPGRFLGEVAEAWKVIYAFGGMSMAVALRGAQLAVDRPDLRLVSANAVFCAPISCGPVEVDARVLRSGRTAVQAVAEMRNVGSGDVGVHLTATWGSHEAEAPIRFVDLAYPEGAGQPDDHDDPPPKDPDDPFPLMNFHQQVQWRPAIGNKWWDPPEAWVPGPARAGSWFRFRNSARLADGQVDPVALCVPADQLGSAIGQTLGPRPDAGDEDEELSFFTVTLEMGLQVLAPTTSEWLFQHIRAPHAAGGYATGIVELWDADQRLVALADQRARIRVFRPGDGFMS